MILRWLTADFTGWKRDATSATPSTSAWFLTTWLRSFGSCALPDEMAPGSVYTIDRGKLTLFLRRALGVQQVPRFQPPDVCSSRNGVRF